MPKKNEDFSQDMLHIQSTSIFSASNSENAMDIEMIGGIRYASFRVILSYINT